MEMPLRIRHGSERNLQPAIAVEVVAAGASEGLRDVGGQRDIVPHRSHDAGGDAAVDIVRVGIRDRPVVDDDRSRSGAELHDTTVADDVVIRRQVYVGADDFSGY